MSKTACYNCKAQLKIENTANIARSEECPSCYANIRCCMMCEFYDKNSYNECREPSAERHLDKEKSNFCDYYKFDLSASYQEEKQDALSIANALFKK